MKKNILYTLFSLIVLSSICTITSCSGDDPSATEKNLSKLTAHGWTLSSVTVGGVDRTSSFAALSIEWNKNQTFATTNGGIIWPSVGTWSFTDGTGQTILVSLNNNTSVEATLETLSDTQLVVSLHWSETTLGHGRVKSVEGDHIFEFEALN
jgi:hypothetical protein